MYKKLSVIVVVLLIIIITCSCSPADKIDGNTSIKTLLSGDYSFTVGYDDPLCLSSFNNIAIAEGGYYFTGDKHQMLYYFDKATKKIVPVCNRPECFHDNLDCNAYLGEIRHYSGLWYYDSKLYILGYKSGIMGLYTISKDGSVRSRLCDLFETGKEFSIITTIHRGYVYFSVNGGNDRAEVYRKKLDNKDEPELIFEFEKKDAMVNLIRGYRNGVFISSSYYDGDNNENWIETLDYYNSDNNTVTGIELEDYLGQFTVCDGSIIYGATGKVLKYDSKDNSTSVFYEDEFCAVAYDGKYIYLDNDGSIFKETTAKDKDYDTSRRHIVVMDTSGNKIDDIHIETNGLCYFGDSDYLFVDMNEKYDEPIEKRFDHGNVIHLYSFPELTRLEALDKSQIGTAKHGWMLLKEWDLESMIG